MGMWDTLFGTADAMDRDADRLEDAATRVAPDVAKDMRAEAAATRKKAARVRK